MSDRRDMINRDWTMSTMSTMLTMRMARVAGLLCLAAIGASASSTPPAVLQVAPILIDIAQTSNNGVLRLTNAAQHPVAVQLTAYAWQQTAGEDRLLATTDVAVSPAIARIQPGATQIVRMLFIGAAAPPGEASYRIIADELPDASRDGMTGTGTGTGAGPQVRLRLSVPLFRGSAPVNPAARAALSFATDGAMVIIGNPSGRRARLVGAHVVDAAGATTALISQGPAYVLARSSRRLALASGAPCIAAGTRLVATIDAGPLDVPLTQTCTR